MSKALSSVEPLLGRFFMMKLAVVVVVVVRTGNGTSLGFDLSVSSAAFATSFFSWPRTDFVTLGHILIPPLVIRSKWDFTLE